MRVALSSSRPMSSKWPTSARTLPSSLPKDWKEDDLELLEAVMPGGEPGLGRTESMSRSRSIVASQVGRADGLTDERTGLAFGQGACTRRESVV